MAEKPSEGARRSLFSMALWGPEGPPETALCRRDWVSCPEQDGHDEGCLGHVFPIRAPASIPPPDIHLSRDQMRELAKGYRPMDMNDKWLAFMEEDRLFIHRSWTRHGIYEVKFAAKELDWMPNAFMPVSAWVERHTGRWPLGFDPIRASRLLRDLIVHVSGEPMQPAMPVVVSRSPVLEAVLGDIVAQDVDAIVHPANTRLEAGGGVSGAIHHAAGPELLAACRALGGCPVGRAAVTPGFRLDARWVIHTATPGWNGGTRGEPVLLESCYRESLARADEVGAETIAFPALSTGARGYPLMEAARIAVDTVRSTSTRLRTVRFVCFDRPALGAFQSALDG